MRGVPCNLAYPNLFENTRSRPGMWLALSSRMLRRLIAPVALLALAACSGDQETAVSDKPDKKFERPDPSDYESDLASTTQSSLSTDAAATITPQMIELAISFDPDALRTVYLDLLSAAEPGCPDEIDTVPDEFFGSLTYWYAEDCTTSTGVTFRGQGQYGEFDEVLEDDTQRIGWLMSAEMMVSATDGRSLEGAFFIDNTRYVIAGMVGTFHTLALEGAPKMDLASAAGNVFFEGDAGGFFSVEAADIGGARSIVINGTIRPPSSHVLAAVQFDETGFSTSACALDAWGRGGVSRRRRRLARRHVRRRGRLRMRRLCRSALRQRVARQLLQRHHPHDQPLELGDPSMVTRALVPILLLSLAACGSSDDVTPTKKKAPEPTGLDAREILIRASLDMRGIRPSAGELATVRDTPDELDNLIATFVDHPGFSARVRTVWADALRTRQDFYPYNIEVYGLPEEDQLILHGAIAEEALNIIGHVAAADLPFSEILTADYTVVHPILLNVWPLAQSEEQPATIPEGTVMARYQDNRPAAGVLGTNAFWWRHTSTVDNANRGRTNAVSRAFLCEDYLDRPIDFPTDVDLADPDSIFEAIKDNPGCTACHATLDPFASHMWGFMYITEDPEDVGQLPPGKRAPVPTGHRSGACLLRAADRRHAQRPDRRDGQG